MSDASRERLAGLSRAERALLFERIRRRRETAEGAAKGRERIPRRPAGMDPVPASFAQERLWLADRLLPDKALYNLPLALRIAGELAPAALDAVLGEVVRRHEALRTTFHERDGQPVQVIAPPGPWSVPVVDLAALPAARRERAARRLAEAAALRPFDLGRGPLLRAALLRLGAGDHVLFLGMHHIVSDGWSLGVLVREITALYGVAAGPAAAAAAAAVASSAPPLPPLPIQYADFAVWQRRRLTGEGLDGQLAYWRERLAGAPAGLDLPTDRPRPASPSHRGARLLVDLGGELASGLARLARLHEASSFMVLLAGFQALLGRLSGQDDLTVGSPIANRTHRELEGLIGFFVNTLVLRADLSGDPSFGAHLARVRQTALDAYAHQDLPFERLVTELRPERQLGATPLFQVLCALQNAPVGRMELPGLAIAPLELAAATARFELELNAQEADGSLVAAIAYRAELFDAATVRRLAGHLAALLAAAVAGPERRLAELPLLSPAERHQLLAELNDTARAAAPEGVVERFAAQAARSPGAVAIEAAGGRLTYAELDGASGRLARRLRHASVGPGVVVGLFVERTVELPAGILAVWKAGGAYLPLDPSLPAPRLAFLLADSQAPVVATTAGLAGRLPPLGGGVRTVLLDAQEPSGDPADEPSDPPAGDSVFGEAPAAAPRPGDLAYLIYTSGTTGQPKAALVEHGSLASTLDAVARGSAFGAGDRMPSLASFSFDIFLFELLAPLLSGGTCVLLPLRPTLDPERLAAALATATALHAVPALMRQVVDLVGRRGAAAPVLRHLFTGGDAVPADLLADLTATFPHAAVQALYGPTEAAIVCAAWRTPRQVSRLVSPLVSHTGEARSLLGRPLAGVEIRLCDRAGQPVPIGVRGEIWIGGAGVARGYWRREELTAERFVSREGRRWFRSGDLARRLPDGRLEFLGRADDQVKVRGFRIEPAEVEAALLAHPSVTAAAVLARETASGDRQLVACLVPRAGGEIDRRELAGFLAGRLPEPMVPAVFVSLAALPLTAHGKVDRRALAGSAALAAPAAAAAAPPRTPAEALLVEIWRQVLQVERVGVDDNFFRLGGDSILSIQVVARARQAGLALTPRQLFESQTIAALAAAALPVGAAGELAGEQGPVEGEAPLTPIQRHFLARPGPDPHHFNQSLLLAIARPTAPSTLARAVAAVTSHHDALRLRFEPAGAGWRSWIPPAAASGEDASFRLVDLAALPGERLEAAIDAAAGQLQAGLDLTRGPLFAAACFAAGAAARHRLLLVAHHLVVDAVSWRLLLEDLETVCRQLETMNAIAAIDALDAIDPLAATAAPAAIRLPAKTTSWKRWAERLAEHARSDEVRAELPGWLAMQAAASPPLPVDRPGGDDTAGAAAAVASELSPELTAALLTDASAAYRTRVDELLLAALTLAFARWTGEPRLLVDLEGHGREEEAVPGADLSRTVGWFTTLYPVVFDLTATAGPGDAIRAVKERLRALRHHGIGYGLLRHLAGGETGEALAALPSPQVVFNNLGQLDAGLAAPGVARFVPVAEPAGAGRSPRSPRRHRIEVDAAVLGGRLRVDWRYGARAHERATIERLARGFEAALAELVEHCLSPAAGGFSPADFPLAGLDPARLDALAGTGARLDRTIEDLYPLAPLQEGMLFESLYAPGAELYFEHLSADFAGPLDHGAFVGAWQALVDRHPALRTSFLWDGQEAAAGDGAPLGLERPLQVVRRGVELPWTFEDWRLVPRQEIPARLAAWLAADRARPFDLARPPLLRAALLRTGERRARFVWSFHHLIFDGWCFAILFRELFELYRAAVSGAAAALPPARPYRDFLAWLARRDRAADERYFRRLLAGFAAPTRLPLDRLDARPGDGAAEDELRLPPALAAGLAALAEARGLTLATLVQGAWAVLLARYGGEEDVVFGSVLSGRPAELPGVESIVGLFINTLPVRVAVAPRSPLAAWLTDLQGRLLELRQHEAAPLAEVQRASELPPGEPLFGSLVAFENYPLDDSLGEGGGDLTVSDVTFTDRADYPLSLAAIPGRGRPALALRLAHDRRLDPTTARRLLAHLERLLGAFAASPKAPALTLDELPALAAAERHQLLYEWNDTAPGGEEDGEAGRLHEPVLARARRSPEAVAVVAGDDAMTYGELARRARSLGARLRALGAGPEARVALAVERSPEMVIALLGILAASGAYVPIDPETPADRLSFLLADARPALLLTSAALFPRLPAELRRSDAEVPVVTLDGDGESGPGLDAASADEEAAAPAAGLGGRGAAQTAGAVDPAGLAYVIYTSGSTGTPKGVAVAHRSATAYARTIARLYGLGPGDRELQFASVSFDASVEEIFAPLAAGAAIVLRAGPAEEPPRFLDDCAEQAITVLSLPTAYWHQIAAAREAEDLPLPPGLRLVVVGGERALPERWISWAARAAREHGAGRGVRLVNAYGPTEATVAATLHERPAAEGGELLAGRREVPIGRPLPGVRAYVVDRGLRPVPAGAPGELLLGGVGLARGYLDRPGLTAERFVPDPFAGAPGEGGGRAPGSRLYRTGDLARLLADGTLELAGRLDTQVKVRGFRVELGEIEAALAAHPDVRDAAAGVREDASGNRRLVGYVVARDPASPVAAAALRAFLGERLPAYMVPARARPPRRPAAHRLRQARPAGAGTGDARGAGSGGAALPGAAQRDRGAAGGDLVGSPRSGAGRPRRRFLRLGRPFAPRHPARLAAAPRARRGAAAPAHLRAAAPGGARRRGPGAHLGRARRRRGGGDDRRPRRPLGRGGARPPGGRGGGRPAVILAAESAMLESRPRRGGKLRIEGCRRSLAARQSGEAWPSGQWQQTVNLPG